MSRRSKNKKYQQTQTAQAVEPIKVGPHPIKILAIGVGLLLIIIAAVNIFVGNLAIGASTEPTAKTNSGTAAQPLAGTLAPTNNGVQEVAITMNRGQYQPDPIRVKVGVPVRFTVDLNSVNGCYRSIIIPDLGVSGRASASNNIIEFTPTKVGTFRMTCSMGMAEGTIVVEDALGNAPAAAPSAAKPAAAAGCGMGGGCGCGG